MSLNLIFTEFPRLQVIFAAVRRVAVGYIAAEADVLKLKIITDSRMSAVSFFKTLLMVAPPFVK